MPGTRRAHTRIERLGSRRARDLRQHLSADVRRAREDAGLSQRAVARAAGVSSATLSALELGRHDPSTEVLARVGAALGLDLSVRFYSGTGPLVRDHLQATMIEALLRTLHERWRPSPEVWVTRLVRGVIDLVLEPTNRDEPLVAVEAQSELRRLEQQLRWSGVKADALAQSRGRAVSTLLLVRNTRHMRTTIAAFAGTVEARYGTRSADAFAALTTAAPWPGAALL